VLELRVAVLWALSVVVGNHQSEWPVEHASFVSSNSPAILGEVAKGYGNGKCEVQCDIPKRV
jgi:hypothetical protein